MCWEMKVLDVLCPGFHLIMDIPAQRSRQCPRASLVLRVNVGVMNFQVEGMIFALPLPPRIGIVVHVTTQQGVECLSR
jgi:hypothetical protein